MTVTIDFLLLVFAGILTFASLKTSYYILKVLAGIAWWGLGAYWIAVPFTTAGNPEHIIALLVAFIVGIAMMFFPFWESKFKNGAESGGGFRFPFMASQEEEDVERQRRYLPTRRERSNAYQDRLNVVLRGERRRR